MLLYNRRFVLLSFSWFLSSGQAAHCKVAFRICTHIRSDFVLTNHTAANGSLYYLVFILCLPSCEKVYCPSSQACTHICYGGSNSQCSVSKQEDYALKCVDRGSLWIQLASSQHRAKSSITPREMAAILLESLETQRLQERNWCRKRFCVCLCIL